MEYPAARGGCVPPGRTEHFWSIFPELRIRRWSPVRPAACARRSRARAARVRLT